MLIQCYLRLWKLWSSDNMLLIYEPCFVSSLPGSATIEKDLGESLSPGCCLLGDAIVSSFWHFA